MPSMLSEYVAGTAFGSALFAAGVFAPGTIIAQMRLEDFTMAKAMMAASGVSALVIYLADHFNLSPIKPRNPQNIGVFPYDGNVIGGAMIGVGMAVTGACPGTVFVQAGAGLSSGNFVLLGGLLGGLAFVSAQPAIQQLRNARVNKGEGKKAAELTIPKSSGVSAWVVLAVWEALCISLLKLISDHESSPLGALKRSGLVSPTMGGLLIGLAQATSLVLTRHTVGTSGAFEDIGRWTYSLFQGSTSKGPLTASVIFDAGIVSASALLSRFSFPGISQAAPGLVSPAVAVMGGAVMAFGSRLAGGCTSGHGISGLATFSWASLVTVVSMFAAGMVTAAISG